MRPRETVYRVPVRWAAPQAIAQALGLGWLHGKAIRGDNGALRYGWPGLDTDRTMYKGYVDPPQLFIGYNPSRVAAGVVRPDPASLPGDSLSAAAATSPLARAMSSLTISQIASNAA